MSAFSSTRVARNALCLVLLASISACAGTDEPDYPVPDEPGIYAFTHYNDVRRLDGDREWEVETWPERSNMPSNVHFVINEPALAGRSAGNSVELWRVAWVRSEVSPQGQAMPTQGSEWAVAPLEPFAIPFRYESPPGQTDIVHIVPTVPLDPGLYTLRIANARQARIGVTWNGIDQRQYSAMNCVDRYDGNIYRLCNAADGAAPAPAGDPYAAAAPTANASNGGLASLAPPQPAPAGVQPLAPAQPVAAATSAQGLQIALENPVRRNDGLLIQGTVHNTSNQVRAIPTMQGSLENSAGQEMRRWIFQPPVQSLAPGERANFSTEVRPIPAGTARASVAFIAGSR